jgi:hypothetical protein
MDEFADCFATGAKKYAKKEGFLPSELKITIRNFQEVMKEKPQNC